MKDRKKTVKEVLAERECELPGSDLGKTLIYMCFPLLILILITDIPNAVDALMTYQRVSVLILLLCIGLAIYSSYVIRNVAKCMTNDLEMYCALYIGKLTLMLSVFLFFTVISLWFMILGGVVSSPFASLLTISPILLTVQWARDRPSNYDKILWAIRPYLSSKAAVGTSYHKIIKWLILILGILPIFVIISTVTVGEALIVKLKIHDKLTQNNFESIVQTSWYVRVYIAVYFISMAVAVFGTVPQRITRKITKRFFL